jgi:hypothetical protein
MCCACCPAVLLSCCPAVLLSCCPAVLLSCCPAAASCGVDKHWALSAAWAYCEALQHVQQGQRVLQLGVGSGVKGAVAAWEALWDIPLNTHPAWAHLGGRPYEDADLPRSIMEEPQTDAFLAQKMSGNTAAWGGLLCSSSEHPVPVCLELRQQSSLGWRACWAGLGAPGSVWQCAIKAAWGGECSSRPQQPRGPGPECLDLFGNA